jgi:hypothetical protein
MPASSSEQQARRSGLWLAQGESTPATTVLTDSPTTICIDEAPPRCRGYMSKMAIIRIGKAMATPIAFRLTGSTAQRLCARSPTIRL